MIKSKKNPNDPLGNRTCGLPDNSAVPETNALLCTPSSQYTDMKFGIKDLESLCDIG